MGILRYFRREQNIFYFSSNSKQCATLVKQTAGLGAFIVYVVFNVVNVLRK